MEIQKCIPQRIGTRKCVLLRIKIKNCQCQETREGFQRRTRCLFRPLLSFFCGDSFRPSILFQIGWIGLIIPDFQKNNRFLTPNRKKNRFFGQKSKKKTKFFEKKSIFCTRNRFWPQNRGKSHLPHRRHQDLIYSNFWWSTFFYMGPLLKCAFPI